MRSDAEVVFMLSNVYYVKYQEHDGARHGSMRNGENAKEIDA